MKYIVDVTEHGIIPDGITVNTGSNVIYANGNKFVVNSNVSFTGKIFAILFPIATFAMSGYEHCVANMYMITNGLFIKHGGNCYIRNSATVGF